MSGVLQLLSSGGAQYWLAAQIGDGALTADAWYTSYLAVDAAGNSHSCSTLHVYDTPEYDATVMAKLSPSGGFLWGRKLVAPTGWDEVGVNEAVVDASGNLYVAGFVDDNVAANPTFGFVAKYNSSGVIQWQRKLAGVTSSSMYGVAVDDSGNVFASGMAYNGTTYSAVLAKYNSSGALQWQKSYNNGSGGNVWLDGSGNIYLATNTGNNGLLYKLDSSGNITWQRQLSTTYSPLHSVAIDGSGNIYLFGLYGTSNIACTKLDSSGAILWSKGVDSAGGYGTVAGTIGDDGNLYVAAQYSFLSTNSSRFAAISSAGAEVRRGDIGSSYGSSALYTSAGVMRGSICVDPTGASSATTSFALPSNGSLTGTYSLAGASITYASTFTGTFGDTGLTVSASSFVASAGVLTDSAGPLTDAAYDPTLTVLRL